MAKQRVVRSFEQDKRTEALINNSGRYLSDRHTERDVNAFGASCAYETIACALRPTPIGMVRLQSE